MTDGLIQVARLPVPGRGPVVQGRQQPKFTAGKLQAEQLREQVVVAIPLAPIIQRHQEQIGALEWSGVPQEAVELAVLCEDPDAPRGTFTHWVLAGLRPTVIGLAEGEHPAGAVEGRNDFGEEGYSGPLPPVGDGPHGYFFRVFAASTPLGLVAGASADDLRRALEGKELASGTLIGTYQR